MKVEAIRLINFMAFEDTGWIELRPITLLFGRNSSGKSAIIRALLLLKQSLGAVGEQQLLFEAENGLVDLGDFGATVHRKPGEEETRNHLDRSIVFGIKCDLSGDGVLNDIQSFASASPLSTSSSEIAEKIKTSSKVELLIGFGWYVDVVKPNLVRLNMLVGDDSICLVECMRPDDQEVEVAYVLISDVAYAEFDSSVIEIRPREKTGFWTTFAAPMPEPFKPLDDILVSVQQGISEFLEGIVHVGPIRPQPERLYFVRSTDKPYYKRTGLLGWYDFLASEVDESRASEISNWMRRLGLGEAVRVNAQKAGIDGRNLPATLSQVVVSDSKLPVNIRDVGFGAAQVLPVVSAAALAKPGSLVIVEQPELHLHPGAQAKLADLFIEVMSRESQNAATNFLLETHSENLFLRFRVRLAQTNAYEDQKPMLHQREFLAVFLERNGEVTRVETIEFDELGAYVQQPKGFVEFFGDDFVELQALRGARSAAAAKSQLEA